VTLARGAASARAVALAGLLSLLAACQSAPPGATAPAASDLLGFGPTQSLGAPETFGPPPSPTPPEEPTAVVLDPTLLDFLPATVADIPVTESTDEAAHALGDPALPKIATAMDAGVAVDTGSGNLVVAWVVRLRPDKFSDAIYQQWRDSYDEGACAGGGGVVGRAEATIDERTMYITSCAGGLRTYHVWLKGPGVVISASAIGDGKFGELVMDNLRVPA
jgi:hypothetical protein